MKENNIIYYIFLKLVISYFIEVCDFNCPNKNFYTHTVWVTASTRLIAVSFLMWHDIMHAMPYTMRRMCFFHALAVSWACTSSCYRRTFETIIIFCNLRKGYMHSYHRITSSVFNECMPTCSLSVISFICE